MDNKLSIDGQFVMTSCTLQGGYFMKEMSREQSILLFLGFSEACLLLLSNFLANVIWGFNIPLPGGRIFHFVQDGGVLTFPLIYIITDLIVELYDRKIADQVAGYSAWINGIALIFCYFASVLPTIPGTGSEIAQQALSFSARISLASIIAFYVSQIINNRCYEWLRKHRRHLTLRERSLLSSFIARPFDTLIFNLTAFLGHSPLSVLVKQIIWALIVPSLIEALLNPLTKLFATKLAPQSSK